MIFFSLVFTLVDKDPFTNKYIDMFLMMFKSLCQTGTFDPTSKIYVMADAPTWVVLQSRWDPSHPELRLIQIPRPASLLEGITRRYEVLEKIPEDDTVIYLDNDMLALKKFHLNISPDTIAVYPEGGRFDPNYCGEDNWAQLDHPGLSAGFWAVRRGPDMLALFAEIRASVARGPHNFYTVEQVHFNTCITRKTRFVLFDPSIISFNGHNMTKDTVLVNLAGCPGDADFHYQKMAQFAGETKGGT